MNLFVKIYTVIFALVLLIGETLIALNTEKYWPLSLDDFVVAILLIVTAKISWDKTIHWFMPVLWAFACGNLYAMLFTRLDPVTGSGERIGLVTIALLAAAIGLAGSLIARKSKGS
ncbi:hypothetical protein M3P05_05590 [Sansalvadorimonas sp. 2012CJ34-2]|uniref:Uncharacterized protein n=1 Tax=Parendozoicomonas callyspongiae TaxID=2942213 RepID=A0ABT0PDG1_9GAMM|nr:hypothetical protein [Sansalvadorimonas sp. 2012CJ34-2]MCL6269417.1 hypothetical protein [Sansalvadorimonas sp. 2012CJ34-2]